MTDVLSVILNTIFFTRSKYKKCLTSLPSQFCLLIFLASYKILCWVLFQWTQISYFLEYLFRGVVDPNILLEREQNCVPLPFVATSSFHFVLAHLNARVEPAWYFLAIFLGFLKLRIGQPIRNVEHCRRVFYLVKIAC